MRKPIFATLVLAASVAGLLLIIAAPEREDANIPPQEIVEIPPFASAVEGVEIISGHIVDETVGKAVEVTIQNNTPRKIIAIQLWNGTSGHGRGIGSSENPLIAPGGQFTMRFQVGNLTPGKPIAVSSVVWDDETASGYPFQTRNFGREIKADAAKRRAENQ